LETFVFALLCISLAANPAEDWLISPPKSPVVVADTTIGGRPAVIMSNGLISRTFIVSPNWATYSYSSGGDELLRSVQPEASFQLDNATDQIVGGVTGMASGAYLNSSDPLLTVPSSYQYKAHRIVPVRTRYEWTPGTRHSNPETPWPPPGKGLEVVFSPPPKPPQVPTKVLTVQSTENLTTARQEWVFPKKISGRRFRFEFGETFVEVAPFLPKINELQLRINGIWLVNNGTNLSSIVTASSAAPAGAPPGMEKSWRAFDGDVSTLWDAVGDAASGKYWIDVDLSLLDPAILRRLQSAAPSASGSASAGSTSDADWSVTFDGMALTTQIGFRHWPPPGSNGYFWRPRTISILEYAEGKISLPDVTLVYEMYEVSEICNTCLRCMRCMR
jgi:hypothetical protein